MTNKSLSEQICEECGIKKKRVELYNCKGCKYLINNECERGDNSCKPPYKYVYPDFENNNNNFIKIQELKIKSSNECLGFILWAQDYRFYDKKSFLDSLLCYLDCVQDIYLEDVKQSIREATWEI